MASGVASIIGNKGGMAISFRVWDTSYLFISCHLAARPSRSELRVQNYHDLVKKIRLGNSNLEVLTQFDYVFFMGDFNFRVDLPFEETVAHVEREEFQELINADQMARLRKEGKVFGDFTEEKVTFRPTYRRNRKDQLFSNKKA